MSAVKSGDSLFRKEALEENACDLPSELILAAKIINEQLPHCILVGFRFDSPAQVNPPFFCREAYVVQSISDLVNYRRVAGQELGRRKIEGFPFIQNEAENILLHPLRKIGHV